MRKAETENCCQNPNVKQIYGEQQCDGTNSTTTVYLQCKNCGKQWQESFMNNQKTAIELAGEFIGEEFKKDMVKKYDEFVNRKVGAESRKTYLDKIKNGFFDKYMSGENGIEVGYSGYEEGVVPILETAKGFDLKTEGYDGLKLPFNDGSQDYLYSSHVLEHLTPPEKYIKEWFRVLKKGTHMVTVVPHKWLYEKKESPPSNFNADHKNFYNSSDLLKQFETALPVNSYRVRHLRENDEGHCYEDPPTTHGRWLYEIELVIQKL